MNFVFKTRNCVSKTRSFVFKMMNFAGYAAVRLLMMFYLLWLHIMVLFVLDWAVEVEQEEDNMEHKAA